MSCADQTQKEQGGYNMICSKCKHGEMVITGYAASTTSEESYDIWECTTCDYTVPMFDCSSIGKQIEGDYYEN